VRQRLAARADATLDASLDAPAALPLRQLLHRLAAHAEPATARPAPLRWLQANAGASIQMIDVAEVLFFVSDEKYTRVQTAGGEALIRKPIKELVDELDPERFWQIHRSTVVNVEAIANVVRDERGRQVVGIKGRPEKLEVSRSYAGLFKGM
jgi:DNA-binding LytR/AlgR family response regulator